MANATCCWTGIRRMRPSQATPPRRRPPIPRPPTPHPPSPAPARATAPIQNSRRRSAAQSSPRSPAMMAPTPTTDSTFLPIYAASPRRCRHDRRAPHPRRRPRHHRRPCLLVCEPRRRRRHPYGRRRVDVDTLVRRVREMQPALAIIERANAMPKQGVASTFKYGVAYGALRTVVALCNIPYRLVTPGKWKTHFHLDADKEKSRALAIQLWPGCGYFALKKHHGRAEAALIARYGAETIATSFVAPSDKCEAAASRRYNDQRLKER